VQMTTQDRLDALSCTSSERSCLMRQKKDPRHKRIFDQAVNCTHDRHAMRSEMTSWRVPRTGADQRLLHTTSAIVDTDVRQRATRDLKRWVQEQRHPGTSGMVFTGDLHSEGTLRLTHNGQLPRTVGSNRSRSCNRSCFSSPTLRAGAGETTESPLRHPFTSRPYLPPWCSQDQWDQVVQRPPPRWAGKSWATVSGGLGGHWSGAAVLPGKDRDPYS